MRDIVRLVELDKLVVTVVTDNSTDSTTTKRFVFNSCKFSWYAVAASLLSPTSIKFLKLSMYTPQEIIGLANFLDEKRTYGLWVDGGSGHPCTIDACAFLNHLYGGIGVCDFSSGPFLQQSVLRQHSPVLLQFGLDRCSVH